MPAQELSEAGKYLAAAYCVFIALLLVYFSIMAVRLSRIERQIGELLDDRSGRFAGETEALNEEEQREEERV